MDSLAWRRRGQRSPLLSKCALRCLRPRTRPTAEESVAPLTWACALLGRNTGTKTKEAEIAALKRLKKNLKSIEASGLQDGTAPRCHHACHWRQKSGDESFTRAGVDFRGTLHDCDFAKIKIGLNVIQIFRCADFGENTRQDIGVGDVIKPGQHPQLQWLIIRAHFRPPSL
jgi:hypothetical protein